MPNAIKKNENVTDTSQVIIDDTGIILMIEPENRRQTKLKMPFFLCQKPTDAASIYFNRKQRRERKGEWIKVQADKAPNESSS
ncbi:MAG: hypothetical protein IPP15_20350 [Saprospiraceae bacterium]|uniref:Uncharacterized protein n=1 Tax=Candidatus Opimibacter skivensis TaxID=2982028 RepID=A0A9D7SZ83_9BACT|nr:hypothetical protein [Candidatus Opimibacter skivensis]